MRAESLATVLLIATALSASAQTTQTKEEGGSTAASIEIPVAIGQNVKGIRLPHYENGDKLSMRFNADSAERASETKFNFKGLRIEVFDDSPDKPAMEVVLDRAVYDRDTGLLTSEDRAKITGETFEIIGQQLEFDSKTRSSRLLGPVLMTIIQMEEKVSP
ncbi:MAG: LPS export ABC transporter periplasmic protein LptC [Chthoniobacterales bacterium]|nr:LPS export ABC transporter periplasmic protein LptC [Chthoniobacterales bacterium]